MVGSFSLPPSEDGPLNGGRGEWVLRGADQIAPERPGDRALRASMDHLINNTPCMTGSVFDSQIPERYTKGSLRTAAVNKGLEKVLVKHRKTSTGATGWRVALSCLLLTVTVQSAAAETRYFKVAEWPGNVHVGDSYVLPVTDPAHIAHAEDLISRGPAAAGSAIPVARIAPGGDGINRDFNQVGHPLWSWHVTELQGFFDVTIEIIDGTPSMVEDDIPFWMGNTGGQIGFWSYTVVEDVTAQVPEPASSTLILIGTAAALLRRRARA